MISVVGGVLSSFYCGYSMRIKTNFILDYCVTLTVAARL